METCITAHATDPNTGEVYEFDEMFGIQLLHFCLHVASADGTLGEKEVAEINWLLGYDDDPVDIDSAVRIAESTWENELDDLYYPSGFMALVQAFGSDREDSIMTTAEIASFFRQIARYVYSIGHSEDLLDVEELKEYVDAFDMYVERVSAIGYSIPDGEYTIGAVRKSWEKLAKADEEKTYSNVSGVWRAVSGNALGKGGLSDFVLKQDGTGYMVKKKLFGTGKVEVTWELSDLMDAPFPLVHIPSMNLHVVFTVLDPNRMAAMIKSTDSSLNNKMAVYHRVFEYEM